jgi:transglycosylase-like protein with SLT domain
MEQRPKRTVTRTLCCGKTCLKFALTLALFAPALSSFKSASAPEANHDTLLIIEKTIQIGETVRPRELVKINAILRAHRPEIPEPESWRLSEVILEESLKRHLDPFLVLALIRVESGFQPDAVSPMGARGIMQIMPDTGKFLAATLAGEYGFHSTSFKPESLDDPVLNLRLGIYYLHDLKKQFQHLDLALTAYNFGPSDTQNRLENNLDLSDEFAALVLNAYQYYKNVKPAAF